MSKHGVNVPPGIVALSVPEAVKAAQEMEQGSGEVGNTKPWGCCLRWSSVCSQLLASFSQVVLKSQILAGGRGLGTFKNGLKGGVHMVKVEDVAGLAEQMLGQVLVTKQTGEQGKPVNALYVAKKMQLQNEKYFAIMLDRASGGPVVIACSEGGTSIEDLAEQYPDKIIKVPVDINEGMTDDQAARIVQGLQVSGSQSAAADQIKALYSLFVSSDCTMVEVNPLAEDPDGNLIAADAKLGFDDNAEFRQKDLFALKDASQIDAREVAASKWDLNYIGLDGEIGCMVNGAGLAMATMDIIKLHGGTPANFLDVGGSAEKEQIVEAFKILTMDDHVKAILVNIFGGIMKCDVIAAGIVDAAKHLDLKVPLVVRLEGTNVERGKEIMESSGLAIITAHDLDDAAKKAVHAIKN